VDPAVPAWVGLVSAALFGCSAYLATRLAAVVYGNDAPLEDGPVPGRPPVIALVAIGAAIGAIAALRGADVPSLAIVDLIVFALCAVIWTDVTRGFIGDWFVLPPLGIVLVLGALKGDIVPMAVAIAIVTVPFAVAAFASKGMGMGWGDVKLVALGAALLDVQTSILMYAVACVVACGVAFARRKRAEPIAFAPYLAGAIALGMLFPRTPLFV
jgi:prepilin signal peptidase PulO-like enzyme (type II secretory pathway)